MKYVGVMVGSFVFEGLKKGKFYNEEISLYEEAGEKYHLMPCYFRFKDIMPGVKTLNAYIKREDGQFVMKTIPKPMIIHNRIFTGSRKKKEKIRKLFDEGIVIFNENNRYKKFLIHEVLKENKELLPHLPYTVNASPSSLINMMDRFNEIMIKPDNSSLGSGISKLTKLNNHEWELSYTTRRSVKKERFEASWPLQLEKLMANPRVILQERIPLARSKGGIFDMRVSVQKNENGAWQVSGIVGKVASKGSYLTNVARGGFCYPLEDLLKDLPHLNFEKVSTDIKNLSLKVVKQLERKFPHIADLGLDIGITNDGFPMFIECNCRDLRITFRNANLIKEWKQTYLTPIGYASYLYKQKIDHDT